MKKTCLLCNGNMIKTFDSFMIEINKIFYIVKNVPCYKCENCGEVIFDYETTKSVKIIIDKLKKQGCKEVSIIDYNIAA